MALGQLKTQLTQRRDCQVRARSGGRTARPRSTCPRVPRPDEPADGTPIARHRKRSRYGVYVSGRLDEDLDALVQRVASLEEERTNTSEAVAAEYGFVEKNTFRRPSNFRAAPC